MVLEKEDFECGLCSAITKKWELYQCGSCKITFCGECFRKEGLYFTYKLSECQDILAVVCPRTKAGIDCSTPHTYDEEGADY